MNVLFVSSGNHGDISPIVKAQGESLRKFGVKIDYYLIKGYGLFGYFKNIRNIRKTFIRGNFKLIHSHYIMSGITASLSGRFPIIVSLMGSEAYKGFIWKYLIKLFYKIKWNYTIVKTEAMKELLNLPNALVIPNGVNFEVFKPKSRMEARKSVGFEGKNKIVLFAADPKREEKNYPLAVDTMRILNRTDTDLIVVFNKSINEYIDYLNSANVLLLTSKREGSVNVVKEALACNIPVVSTDCGDVKKNIDGIDKCFVCPDDPISLANALNITLSSDSLIDGRSKMLSMGLNSERIAERLIEIYNSIN